MQSNMIMAQASQSIPAASFAAKFASKKELFNFLSVEVGAYLCSHEVLTIYFLKDLVSGKKKRKSPLGEILNYSCEGKQTSSVPRSPTCSHRSTKA